ncbi:unnamed protein product [Adineta steineri]|uniref:Uncharacterized protein n=1 Tax=Adineta steineri TaxID=433720 RepID=A0A816BW60_9BILA|nr:unnamed protein product [Adineta steineri]CAF1615854.1 unnamed protein product [Adineta steineri]
MIHDPRIGPNTKWIQAGIAVNKIFSDDSYDSDILLDPYGIDVDDNQTVVITDYSKHRIVEWSIDTTKEQLLAGGRGKGNQNNQLNYPTDVFIDKKADKLIICDRENRRIMKWPRRHGLYGEVIISMIKCYGITMDANDFIYVSDIEKHEVSRWRIGETQGIVVAGANGPGSQLNQLNSPHYIFVDGYDSVYISDWHNHRVMKWIKDAKEGIIVAGGHGEGTTLHHLSFPEGIYVDHLESVYVVDHLNHRIMRWLRGAIQGSILIGERHPGSQANQLHNPLDISFDRNNNLYVADSNNHRVQKFNVDEKTLE